MWDVFALHLLKCFSFWNRLINVAIRSPLSLPVYIRDFNDINNFPTRSPPMVLLRSLSILKIFDGIGFNAQNAHPFLLEYPWLNNGDIWSAINILRNIFITWFIFLNRAEAYLDPSRTSTMELFCKNSYFRNKSSIVDVRLASK